MIIRIYQSPARPYTKAGLNEIYDNGSNYILQHKNGFEVLLDRTQEVLQLIINTIETQGNFQYTKPTNGFFITHSKTGNFHYNLSQILVAYKYDKPIDYIKGLKAKIKHLDGDKSNCTLDNLDIIGSATITYDEHYIWVSKYGKISKVNYSPEMLEIVNSFKWYYVRRGFCAVTAGLFLHYVCYAVYKYHATIKNVSDIVFLMKAKFRYTSPEKSKQLTIDHKDGDTLNNTKPNLHVLTWGLNSIKSDWTKKILFPNIFLPLSTGWCYGTVILEEDNYPFKCVIDRCIDEEAIRKTVAFSQTSVLPETASYLSEEDVR